MKKNERTFLALEKEINGKSREEAYREINDLEEKEKVFKTLWHEKQRLEKTLEVTERQLKEQKEKNFKLKFQIRKMNDSKQVISEPTKGTANHFNRILHFMEVGKPYTKTNLSRDLIIPAPELLQWLKIMEENKIMEIKSTGDHYIRIR